MTASLPQHIAQMPAHLGSRLIARRHLSAAMAAFNRLRSGKDPDALHDLRVALRRLRTALKTYRPHLEDTVRKRMVRDLEAIQDATGSARDTEVMLAQLRRARARLGPESRRLVDSLSNSLAASRPSPPRKSLRRLRELEPTLAEALERFELKGTVKGADSLPRIGAVASSTLRPMIAKLARLLLQLQSAAQVKEVHGARIAGKNVRYVLESFAREGIVAAAVARMKDLQTALGDLHDAQMLAAAIAAHVATFAAEPEDPEHAPRSLTAWSDEHLDELWAEVQQRFTGRRGAELIAQLEAAADAIDSAGLRGREIERKYLLKAAPKVPGPKRVLTIEQGYLPGKRIEERLRRVVANGATSYLRTIKAGEGLSRLEVEEPVAAKLFERLWPLTDGRRVAKTRVEVELGTLTWCIDSFEGRSLVLAEVELTDVATRVVLPAWLRKHVVRDVTGDSRYSNARLAK